ncbi:MAG: AAA family ATPase [Candidatus Micrarchaeota archaeon]|nr:AAA family ATPase [Candidatus Micrarchaeota archaeon]
MDIDTTKEIKIPSDPFMQIIGQDKAVKLARIAAAQHRHLLLIGPPGVGKSMIAKAMASVLPRPKQQISVLHNPTRPERPILKIETYEEHMAANEEENPPLELDPKEIPFAIAYELGYRCKRCGEISLPSQNICPHCGFRKYGSGPFGDLHPVTLRNSVTVKSIHSNHIREYVANGEKVLLYIHKNPKRGRRQEEKKILVPFNRSLFVHATSANETELLGDVEHDPYGGHPEIGIPHYKRVVPGAIHEAHEGVLYIDELSTLKPNVQRALLTAMQEKKFTITGRNPSGTGAIVKVEDVPADFILVGAINVTDLEYLHPALRSRIKGEGYEILLRTWMEDTEENKAKLFQFVAQEIAKDKRIPHADREALEEIYRIAKRMAKEIDEADGITLRLRKLGGLIRAAGDLARAESSPLIHAHHIQEAVEYSKSAEEQLKDVTGGNWWKDLSLDYSTRKPGRDAGVR